MTIKFITLNVWNGGVLMEPMLDWLAGENPDVLVLQEAYNDSRAELPPQMRTLELIQERLKYPATDFAPAFNQDFGTYSAEEGNAVLSRFPVSAREVTFFHAPYDPHYIDNGKDYSHIPHNLQHVTLDTPEGELNVFNFHGVWDLNGDNDSPARQHMVNVLLEHTGAKANVILAGDTNARPTNASMQRLAPPLKSVFGAELPSTFNMRRKDNPGYATAAVDMVFVSPNIDVLAKDCPNIDISDHLPLVTMLKY